MLQLCMNLRDKYNICAVTNDIFTREDGNAFLEYTFPIMLYNKTYFLGEFLTKNNALAPERIKAVETGGCPHAAIREDITANLIACEELTSLVISPFTFSSSSIQSFHYSLSLSLSHTHTLFHTPTAFL